MACPLFLPSSPITDFEFEAMPLGDLYDGECVADRTVRLTMDVLRGCCNAGYARGCCERAAGAQADAVRFLIRNDRNGEVEVAWAMERDHLPVAVGTKWLNGSPIESSDPLERQARAYAASVFRRIGRA